MPLSSPSKLNCTEASAQTLLLLAWFSIWNRKHRFSGSLSATGSAIKNKPSYQRLRMPNTSYRSDSMLNSAQFQDNMSKRSSEWNNHFWGGSVPFWKVLFLPKILSGRKLFKMVKTPHFVDWLRFFWCSAWRSTTLPWAPQIEIVCTPINKTESLCAQSRKVAEVKIGTKKTDRFYLPAVDV